MPKTVCDVCLSENIVLTHRDASSKNHISGWPLIWLCLTCEASVGTHPDSDKPLGLMATKYTRSLRREAHLHFDKIHKCGFMSRERAYRWAREILGIRAEFHISILSNVQLEKLIVLSQEYLEKKGIHKLGHLRSKEWNRQNRDISKEKERNSREREKRRKG